MTVRKFLSNQLGWDILVQNLMISVEREGCRKYYKCKKVELVKSTWPSNVAQLILNLFTAMLLTEGSCLLPFCGNFAGPYA